MESIDKINVGIGQTIAQATAALAAARAQSDARQVEAGRFIRDHGHQVVGGHPPLVAGQDSRSRDAGPA
jgi:hypothetical protein